MAKKTEVQETVTIDAQEAEHLHAADDLMGRIEEAEVVCADAKAKWERAKLEAKLLKESYEMAVDEVLRLARARKESLPLFDGQPGQWRTMLLTEAGLSMELAHPLNVAGLDTFGELVAYMRSQGGRWFLGVKGIGEEKGGIIADVVAKFWTEHPEAAAEFEADGKSE